jgi:hypothetical protein
MASNLEATAMVPMLGLFFALSTNKAGQARQRCPSGGGAAKQGKVCWNCASARQAF